MNDALESTDNESTFLGMCLPTETHDLDLAKMNVNDKKRHSQFFFFYSISWLYSNLFPFDTPGDSQKCLLNECFFQVL